jgi:hypothetical protein
MSSASAFSSIDPEEENWWSKESCQLSKRLCDLSVFLQRLRVQMRFGELTRAPLQLVRFQMNENVAECEWLARQPDPWDEDLKPEIGLRHASLQALQDAADVRSLLFSQLPGIDSAYLRIYRQRSMHARDLVIAGHVQRLAPSFRKIHSIAMRAKLLGFRFSLQNEVLGSLEEMTNLELVEW